MILKRRAFTERFVECIKMSLLEPKNDNSYLYVCQILRVNPIPLSLIDQLWWGVNATHMSFQAPGAGKTFTTCNTMRLSTFQVTTLVIKMSFKVIFV